jgi:glycine/D-amino acid oxidase-like deaminating enzyme
MKSAVTPEKRLLAGYSVWLGSSGTSVKVNKLVDSIRADVVVVGAGISGAFMAHGLAGRYKRVIVADRRAPIQGSTLASTAMLQFEIDQPLTKLADKIGPARATQAWRHSYWATQALVALVKREQIRCGLKRRSALYVAGDDMGSRGLEHESIARNRVGIPGEYLARRALNSRFGINRSGAILSPNSAIANPIQLAAGLLRRAEVLKCLPKQGTKITSSWAIASQTHSRYPAWLDKILLWEASTPYLYLRTTPDGRVIVGGEDEDVDLASYRSRSIDRKSRQLVDKVEALVPGLKIRPTRKWTGAFGESLDGLPLIDAVPGMPRCFAVMGFGGNGTIYSLIAADIVPRLLQGRTSKDASLYRFRD